MIFSDFARRDDDVDIANDLFTPPQRPANFDFLDFFEAFQKTPARIWASRMASEYRKAVLKFFEIFDVFQNIRLRFLAETR